MNAETMLTDLEPLTHHDRVMRMVAFGKTAAAGDASAAAVLADLGARPEVYARLLALQAVYGSRDGVAVLAALRDPSRAVRGRATALLPLACDDAQLAAAFPLVTPAARPGVLLKLRRQHRISAVDAAVRASLATDERTAIDLVAYASAAVATEALPRLEALGGQVTWSRLARWHPEPLAAVLEQSLTQGGGALDPRLNWRLAGVLPTLARKAPDAALTLVARLFERGLALSTDVATLLVRRRPTQMFDLLRARFEGGRPAAPPGAFSGVVFDPVVHRLGGARLSWLLSNAWGTLSDGERGRRWFLRLTPEDRESVLASWLARGRGAWGGFLLRFMPESVGLAAREGAYERWSIAARDKDGVIPLFLLAPLPRDLRIREARRHLERIEALTARPRDRAAYARFLPFEDARAALAPFLGHPEGEERAVALSTLVSCAQTESGCLTALLDLMHKTRRFEQDPVRMAMMRGLVSLPVSRFTAVHLPQVGALVRDALDAADLSWGTAAAVEQLVVRLFRVEPMWGAEWLKTLLATRGSVSAGGLGATLTDPEARAMSPVLAGLAHDWATKERAGALIWLAASLGKRLAIVDPVLEALERLARELPFVGVAGAALGLLRKHARPRFRRLVPALLAADPSFIILPDVARFVSMHRQDLLDPHLEAAPKKGRFASGRTRWIVDFHAGYARWNPVQQLLHADALAALAAPPKLAQETTSDVPAVRTALERLPSLSFVAPNPLLPFAADARPPVREIAIRALPWLDAGEGLTVLLECLGDDRGRWAIYALRKALSELSRARTLEILRAAPTGKVTVAKEVVRLLGELGGEEAWRSLLELDRPDLHRDVRIALLRGLWGHLHREETWAVFERAARDPDWVVASRLADLPLDRLSAGDEERVLGLLAQVLGRPEPEARLALLARVATLPVRDTRRVLFDRVLAHVATPTDAESGLAFSAVLARMHVDEGERVAERVRSLLPRRRTLLNLLDVLQGRLGPYVPVGVTQVADRVLAALSAEPLLVGPYVRLAGAHLGWQELSTALVRLSEQGRLHADALATALLAVQACVHPELLEARLTGHADPQLRRLALEGLRHAAGPQEGWTPERRARLDRYRQDAAPLVAEAAQLTFPPDEAAPA